MRLTANVVHWCPIFELCPFNHFRWEICQVNRVYPKSSGETSNHHITHYYPQIAFLFVYPIFKHMEMSLCDSPAKPCGASLRTGLTMVLMTGVLLITQATVPEFAEKLVSGWIEYDDYDDYDELNDLNAVLIVALKKCAQGDSGFIALLFGMWKAPEGGVIYALSALGTLSFIYNRQHLRNRRHLSQHVSCIFYDVQIVGFCILVFVHPFVTKML